MTTVLQEKRARARADSPLLHDAEGEKPNGPRAAVAAAAAAAAISNAAPLRRYIPGALTPSLLRTCAERRAVRVCLLRQQHAFAPALPSEGCTALQAMRPSPLQQLRQRPSRQGFLGTKRRDNDIESATTILNARPAAAARLAAGTTTAVAPAAIAVAILAILQKI